MERGDRSPASPYVQRNTIRGRCRTGEGTRTDVKRGFCLISSILLPGKEGLDDLGVGDGVLRATRPRSIKEGITGELKKSTVRKGRVQNPTQNREGERVDRREFGEASEHQGKQG